MEKAAGYQKMFEAYKEEDRDHYLNVQVLRLVREGEKQGLAIRGSGLGTRGLLFGSSLVPDT
ncbi:MAG: hypothetical protein HY508_14170 [Acidobacteria bacterium]|nr:hypothetical protein [Acidobacteriota bacterium]